MKGCNACAVKEAEHQRRADVEMRMNHAFRSAARPARKKHDRIVFLVDGDAWEPFAARGAHLNQGFEAERGEGERLAGALEPRIVGDDELRFRKARGPKKLIARPPRIPRLRHAAKRLDGHEGEEPLRRIRSEDRDMVALFDAIFGGELRCEPRRPQVKLFIAPSERRLRTLGRQKGRVTMGSSSFEDGANRRRPEFKEFQALTAHHAVFQLERSSFSEEPPLDLEELGMSGHHLARIYNEMLKSETCFSFSKLSYALVAQFASVSA